MFSELATQFGLFVAGAVFSVAFLGLAVRVLWRQVSDQFTARLTDKNTELTQCREDLKLSRTEKAAEQEERRRAQAATEGMERLLIREQDLAAAVIEQADSWKRLYQDEKRRSNSLASQLTRGQGRGSP